MAAVAQYKQRVEHFVDDAVRDGGAGQPGKPFGGEQGSAACGDAQVGMFAAAVDGGEQGEQSWPGGAAPVADLVAVEIAGGVEFAVEGGCGVPMCVEGLVDGQQPLFLGVE